MKKRKKQQPRPDPGDSIGDAPLEVVRNRNSVEVFVVASNFFIEYLRSVYREFDGDLVLAIVLGELVHHHISHYFIGSKAAPRTCEEVLKDPALWERPSTWNASSLSAAAGIPRETVRRKMEALISKGWLKRNRKGELLLTQATVRHFKSDFDKRHLHELLGLAGKIQDLLTEAHDEVHQRSESRVISS